MTLSFAEIHARAAHRKGGEKILTSLLPARPDDEALKQLSNDRALAEMAKCVFRAGFSWRVVEQKWPGFEQAFLKFAPERLLFQPDDFWQDLASDTRIIRHGAKIMSVRHNAGFLTDTAIAHGSFGTFIHEWPADDLVGLWQHLAKYGSRLGGMTGRYFLRSIGKDSFILSADVSAALRDAGLEIAEKPTSKRDLQKVQNQFNLWAVETGFGFTHISRILAMSIGENIAPERLRQFTESGADSE